MARIIIIIIAPTTTITPTTIKVECIRIKMMGLPFVFSSMTTFLLHNYIFDTDYEGQHKFTMEKANAKNNLKERIELFSN